jgi:hypothetical protein
MDPPHSRKKRQAELKKKDKGKQMYNQKTIRIKEKIIKQPPSAPPSSH